jgi:hypothetical protein
LMRNWGVMFASFYLLEITLEKMRIVVFWVLNRVVR